MASERIVPGPTAHTVRENLARLMKARGMTTAGLKDELERVGRPISATGITKMLKGTVVRTDAGEFRQHRRVDVDDLMALAIALRVNPNALLLPNSTHREERYDVTGAGALDPHRLWDWAEGEGPLDVPDDDDGEAYADFQTFAKPKGRRSYRPWEPAGEKAMVADMPEQFSGDELRVGMVPTRLDRLKQLGFSKAELTAFAAELDESKESNGG